MVERLPHAEISLAAAGLAVAVFVYTGVRLFRRGWTSYEESMVEGAEKTLDAMYLTIPTQQLVYLAMLAAGLLGGAAWAVTGSLFAGVPLALLGLFAPSLVLRYLKRKRDQLFNTQLVDALMNVSNSLKAGLTLPQALEALSREMANPMRQEMRLVVQELRLGRSLDESLGHLYERMPSPDLDLVVTAISIVQDVGGNLTEIFDNIAHTIRERFRIEGRVRALTAQGKLQAIVICLLPVAVLFALRAISPGLVEVLFTTAAGGIVLLIAAAVELFGIWMIFRIVRIDV